MNTMKMLKMLAVTTALAASVAGCKKKEEAPAMSGSGDVKPDKGSADTTGSGSAVVANGSAGSGSADTMQGSAAGSGSAAAAGSGSAAPRDPNADFVSVFANHVEAKPGDPVEVQIQKFNVVKATFDPKKIEGGTAEITLDMTSVSSGSDKRDHHLQTPDYLDAAKYATVTIDIDNVKKKTDGVFSADADVKFRDVDKKYPITFNVVSTTDDSVKIKAEQAFSRLDFKIGQDSPDPKVAPVQPGLTIKMQLTLKKT
jgi:polyisoprenoid-binding protein YceI